MSKSVCICLGLGLVLASAGAAQTVTGSGTSGTVPVFTGRSTIGNSPTPIVVDSATGNVGIATPSPQTTFNVDGDIMSSGWVGSTTQIMHGLSTRVSADLVSWRDVPVVSASAFPLLPIF
jgi:hypothetical protein